MPRKFASVPIYSYLCKVMLTFTSNKSMFGTSIHNLGGVSNCLVFKELTSSNSENFRLRHSSGVSGGSLMHIFFR